MSTSRRLCSRAPRTAITFGSPAGTCGGGRRTAFGPGSADAFEADFRVDVADAFVAFAAPLGAAFATAFDADFARVAALVRLAPEVLVVAFVVVLRRSAIAPAVYSRRTGVWGIEMLRISSRP